MTLTKIIREMRLHEGLGLEQKALCVTQASSEPLLLKDCLLKKARKRKPVMRTSNSIIQGLRFDRSPTSSSIMSTSTGP